MLDGAEKSKVPMVQHSAPTMTHPHPISKHLAKFSDSELNPLRQHVADKLYKMHYAKQLEEMFNLYDCYDHTDENKLFNIVELEKLQQASPWTLGLGTFGALATVFALKRASPLKVSSWMNNVYVLFYSGVVGFAFGKYCISLEEMKLNKKYWQDHSIVMAKAQIHSEATNLVNELRFNKEEMH
jgi:hypothetical protein